MPDYKRDDFARPGDTQSSEKMKVSKKNLIIISSIGVLGLILLGASFITNGTLF